MYILKLEELEPVCPSIKEYTSDDPIDKSLEFNTLDVQFMSLQSTYDSYISVIVPPTLSNNHCNMDSLFELPNGEKFLCDVGVRKKLVEPLRVHFYSHEREQVNIFHNRVQNLSSEIFSLNHKIDQLEFERRQKINALNLIKKEIS